ncbi:hypothetical protein K432DRAFT_385478 [Lepidopterella palustris CBS 459.81]|uniref:Uncharacterized protein n=1 Tax=Lepidopterella palustris CBS 459.81 TaxID=1314670 RepID=A0A8E2JBD7_9PEZI|nr:hypothetical protein K432DRAFT_385478 [Lepidopterella palustris CBS 459.81]
MDHWGDPWADDTETKTPAKEQLVVKQTLRAPPVLRGFEDEAQWGHTEDNGGFRGWSEASSPGLDHVLRGEDGEKPARPETPPTSTFSEALDPRTEDYLNGPSSFPALPKSPPIEEVSVWNEHHDIHSDGAHIAEIQELGSKEGWNSFPYGTSHRDESTGIDAEWSDSGTTVQPDTHTSEQSKETDVVSNAEDDVSTRPSTSPSDESHLDIPAESPRTSFEDEQALTKVIALPPEIVEQIQTHEGITIPEATKAGDLGHDDITADDITESEDDDFGDFQEEAALVEEPNSADAEEESHAMVAASVPQESLTSAEIQPVVTSGEVPDPQHTAIPLASFEPDFSLIETLFPPPTPSETLPIPPEDTISSTSSRKTWYRITRNQTMREFNNGNDDDNYVRVSWTSSHVRTEVNKIVARWTAEDRIAGRAVLGGRAAGTMFFWDQPVADLDRGTTRRYSRSRSSVSSSVESVSPTVAKQVVPPLAASSPVAQFDWSSSPMFPGARSISETPPAGRKRDNSSIPAVSSPLSRTTSTIAKVRGHEARSVSLDMTRETHSRMSHRRDSKSSGAHSMLATQSFAPPPSLLNVTNNKKLPKTQQLPPNKLPTTQITEGKTTNPLPTPPSAPPAIVDADPWAGLTRLDTTSQAAPVTLNQKKTADDNDWGEMVQSPVTPSKLATTAPTTASTTAPVFTPSEIISRIPNPASVFQTKMLLPTISIPSPSTTASLSAPPDPFATADFSIFETPSSPPPQNPASRFPSTRNHTCVPSIAAPTPPARQKEDADAETIRRILGGLPDWGYMLQ